MDELLCPFCGKEIDTTAELSRGTCTGCHRAYTQNEIASMLLNRNKKEPEKPEEPPETKVDKTCVVVLKAEARYYSKILSAIAFIDTILGAVFRVIVSCLAFPFIVLRRVLTWIYQHINWCIVKSIARVVLITGIPLFWIVFAYSVASGAFWNGFVVPWAIYLESRGFFAGIGMVLAIVVVFMLCTIGLYCLIIIWVGGSAHPEAKVIRNTMEKKE